MLSNRSMPSSQVIPVLSYPEIAAAIDWLTTVFGFSLRWRVGNHRAQINVGNGCIAITKSNIKPAGHSIMVRVDDVEIHCVLAEKAGARILEKPADYPYGERQYTAEDLAGHVWTFSQSIADVAPEEWGGVSANL